MMQSKSASREVVNPRRFSVLVTVLLVAGAIPVMVAHDGIGLLVLLILSALLSELWVARCERPPVPGWIIKGAVLAAAAWAAQEYRLGGMLPEIALGRFLVWVAVCKCFEKKTNRDYGQMVVLALLLLVIGARVSMTILFPINLVVFVTFGIYTLVLFHFKREADRVGASQGRAGIAAARGGVAAVDSRALRAGLVRSTGVLAAGASVVALAAFLFAPREGAGAFGRTAAGRATTATGFSDELEFGRLRTRIQQSGTVVMRVVLRRNGEPYGGSDIHPYFRGQTLERYTGRGSRSTRRWEHSPRGPSDERTRIATPRVPKPLVSLPEPDDPADWIEQEITLEKAEARQPLFAIYPPVRLQSSSLTNATSYHRTRLLFGLPRGERRGVRYVVHSPVVVDEALVQELRRRYPGSPANPTPPEGIPVSDRVVQYTAALIAESGVDPANDAAVAMTFLNHLQSGAFGYTLDQSDIDPQTEPIEDFLFNRKKGHCEYFASTMAVMCQLRGIPARVVTGYQGGDFNEVGKFYTVRESHAHSWVEVYHPDADWVIYDPTPEVSEPPSGFYALLGSVETYLSYLQFRWASTVIAYDTDARDRAVSQAGAWMTWARVTFEDFVGPFMRVPSKLWAWRSQVLGLLLVAAACALVAFAIRGTKARRPARPRRARAGIFAWLRGGLLRRLRRTRAGKPDRHPDAAFYDEFLAALARLGCTRAAHQTPREFAHDVQRRLPHATHADELVTAFYQVEYGHRPLDDGQRETVRTILARLQASPRTAT